VLFRSRKMRVLIVGALLLTSVLSADALACKLCLDIVDDIESGSSDVACDAICSELADL